jgi:CheY-like chemotaxis protein
MNVDRTHARERTILADPLNLQKILLNLLTNAIKYTPEGGHVDVIFENEPEDAAEPDSILTVRDNGIGMSREFQEHMYDAFAQEGRTGYGGSGTGLGLSIVRQLVSLMGGSIDVESRKNQGTAFKVRFHFQEADKEADRHTDAEEAGTGYGLLKGKKILVCEDNALNREIVRSLLERGGMVCVEAVNGEEGAKAFRNSSVGEFAGILMDLRMPVMDGLESTGNIRRMDREDAGSVPILAMTADAFDEDVQRCMEAGMNGHLAKPIDPDKMMQMLMHFCGNISLENHAG